MQVQVIGKPLRYAQRMHQVNSIVKMSKRDSRLYLALRRVKRPDVQVAQPEKPTEPAVDVQHKNPRDYLTQSMTAEAEISERTGLPKRQYRRRDMTAESDSK
jgi:hypothetical protein